MTITRRGTLALGAGLAFGGAANAAPPVETPFRVVRNQPWAAVTINAKDPLAFMIDTGSNAFGITPLAASTLGLVPVTTGQVQAAVGRRTTDFYHAKSVVIGGGVRERDVFLFGMPDRRYDFISGMVPVAKFAVMGMDFDRQILSVSRSLDRAPEGYEVLETFARGKTFGTTNRLGAYARDDTSVNDLDQRPVIQATLDGRPLRLLVDTGATMSLALEPDFVRKHNLWDAFPVSAESVVLTMARSAHMRMVRGGRLEFGRFAFERPILTLGNPNDSDEDGTDDIDGVIGFELIRRLNFLHHPGRKRLYIKPSQALHDVYRYDRAGIEIDVVDGALRVVWIRPRGPAAGAGLVVGDKITGWRGKDGYYGLMWALTGAPGTRVEIQVERAGAASLIAVELRDSV